MMNYYINHKNQYSEYTKLLSILFLTIALSSCAGLHDTSYSEKSSRRMNNGMPAEPGKCYAKCLIQTTYEWREVVCQNDITKKFCQNLQKALIEKGFGQDVTPDGSLNQDMETLAHLGIRY